MLDEIPRHLQHSWPALLPKGSGLVLVASVDRLRSVMDRVHQRTMAAAVHEYQWSDQLELQERAALATVAERVKGQPILDLGVGAGRTVKGLLELSTDYIGVDYVSEMVDHCRRAFPGVRFEHGDARSLPQFPDQSFALVVFACNGLGMVDHDARLDILKEVRRLLKPGGSFVFSTCNLNSPNARRAFVWPPYRHSHRPLTAMARAARFARHALLRIVNRLRLKRHEYRTPTYAILNDVSHDYGTFGYFITLDAQRRQLQAAGFSSELGVFDLSGGRVETDTTDGTLTIVATKGQRTAEQAG